MGLDANLRTECPIDPNILLCKQGVEVLLLIPIKAIQDIQVKWWIFRLSGQTGVAKKRSPMDLGWKLFLVIKGSL